MNESPAYERFCRHMTEAHAALKACEEEVDNLADERRAHVAAAIERSRKEGQQ